MTRPALLCVLVSVVALTSLTACGDSAPKDERSLAGSWRTDSYMSQLGPAVVSFVFGTDGSYAMSMRIEMLKGAPLGSTGTWRLEGDALVLDGKQVATKMRTESRMLVTWDGAALVLTEKNGDSYRLLRVEED